MENPFLHSAVTHHQMECVLQDLRLEMIVANGPFLDEATAPEPAIPTGVLPRESSLKKSLLSWRSFQNQSQDRGKFAQTS